MVRKRFAGGIIVSKSGRNVAESLCLQKLFPTLTHSIIVRFDWFLVRSKAIVCVQMLWTSNMRFGHSFIFIGNWVQIYTFCLQHDIRELRGYNGLVCPPDQLLHHSKGPDHNCFCTDHVASCCSRRGFCFSLSSQLLLVFCNVYLDPVSYKKWMRDQISH